jgi:hypothetical protein
MSKPLFELLITPYARTGMIIPFADDFKPNTMGCSLKISPSFPQGDQACPFIPPIGLHETDLAIKAISEYRGKG